MSNDPDFERRINNQLATIAENQAHFDEQIAKMLEAIAGLIRVARTHDERIDHNSEQIAAMRETMADLIKVARTHDEQIDRNIHQIKENADAIKELREGLSEQRENLNALIRIVEGHITNHP